jgi:hypothetical protein
MQRRLGSVEHGRHNSLKRRCSLKTEYGKRIKGFCGAQPPQKPRWTNAGVGVALWRFHSERMVSMLKMLPQAAGILALG